MTGTVCRARVWGLLGILHRPRGAQSTLLRQTCQRGSPRPTLGSRSSCRQRCPRRPAPAVRETSAQPRPASRSTGSRDVPGTPRRGGVLGLVVLMMLLAVVVVTGTAVLTAVGAGTALMASLEQGLPDVHEFDHLQFAQPTKVYDRTGEHLLATFRRREAAGRQVLPDPPAGARRHDRGRGPHASGRTRATTSSPPSSPRSPT